MRPDEIRDLTVEEVDDAIDEAREELMNLRFQISTGELTDHNRLRVTRRQIARLLTILGEMRQEGVDEEEEMEGEE